MNNRLKNALTNLNKIVFQYLLISYLTILLVNEYNKEIFNFLNLNNILIVTLLLGTLTVLTYKSKETKFSKLKRIDNYFIYLLGSVGAILIYIKIKDIGWISYLISIIFGILIITLNKLVMQKENESTTEI